MNTSENTYTLNNGCHLAIEDISFITEIIPKSFGLFQKIEYLFQIGMKGGFIYTVKNYDLDPVDFERKTLSRAWLKYRMNG